MLLGYLDPLEDAFATFIIQFTDAGGDDLAGRIFLYRDPKGRIKDLSCCITDQFLFADTDVMITTVDMISEFPQIDVADRVTTGQFGELEDLSDDESDESRWYR